LKKIALPTSDGFEYVALGDIISITSASNYTSFLLVEDRTLIVSKTLKKFEDILVDFNFFRINRSDIINLNHVITLTKGRSPELILTGNIKKIVAAPRKEAFLEAFDHFKLGD